MLFFLVRFVIHTTKPQIHAANKIKNPTIRNAVTIPTIHSTNSQTHSFLLAIRAPIHPKVKKAIMIAMALALSDICLILFAILIILRERC